MTDADDADLIEVCPFCDKPRYHVNNPNPFRNGSTTCRYRCKECQESFDEPDKRERHTDSVSLSGLSRELLEHDLDADDGEA